MKRFPHFLRSAVVVLLPGVLCAQNVATSSLPQTGTDWMRWLIEELGRSHMREAVGVVVQWTLLGMAAGLVLAVSGFFLFRAVGWYEATWRYARWVKGVVLLSTACVGVGSLGLAGFWEGVCRGAEPILRQSRLATDVLPVVGDALADGGAWLDLVVTRPGDTSQATSAAAEARIQAFQSGEWEWDVVSFLERLDARAQQPADELVAPMWQALVEQYPELNDSQWKQRIRRLLVAFVERLMEKPMGKLGNADQVFAQGRSLLLTVAAKEGNVRTIRRPELSVLIVQEGVVPSLLKPIRSTAWSQQLLLGGVAALVVFLPALLFRCFRGKPAPAVPATVPSALKEEADSMLGPN